MDIKNPYVKENCKDGKIYFSVREKCFAEGVQAALEATREKSFKEQLPEPWQPIIVMDNMNCKKAFFWEDHLEDGIFTFCNYKYTHWRPFPFKS
jgi:hypothetical protein